MASRTGARGLTFVLLASAAGCMSAPESTMAAGDATAAPCTLTVRFGSYAMGIDGAAAQRIEQALRADPAVQAVERKPWGREGEFDLCARIGRAEAAGRVFDRLKPLLPVTPRGPITVTLANGRTYSAPAP